VNLKAVIGTVFLSLLATACATPQYQQVPKVDYAVSHELGKSELLQATDHMTRLLDDRQSILYFQNFGGGGAAVGVMLGPFGVAANMKMIESVTDEDAAMLKGKIIIDPVEIFFRQSGALAILNQGAATGKAAIVSPYLYVSKTEDEQLLVGCALLVDYRPTGTEWRGKYMYQLPLKYAKAEVAKGLSEEQRATLVREVTAGFQSLAKLYVADRKGELGAGTEVKFKSDFVSPRFNFDLIGLQLPAMEGRFNVRTFAGMYSLPKGWAQVAAN